MRAIVLFTLSVVSGFTPAMRGEEHEGIAFPLIGKIAPRHASQISGSNWSIGAETMDRDFTIYDNWKEYLGPLGIKKARIQAGWAKTEETKGVYDFAWLDRVVFDMPKQGVTPWMCLSYGNPIYQGGGEARLMGGVPTSPEALDAWVKWVKANVDRYKGVIREWEVWNEPNYHVAAEDYARLVIVTAEAIRSIQPDAVILAMSLGSGVDYKYANKVLAILAAQHKLHLVDQVTHHRHQKNPDPNEPELELEKVVRTYSDKIVIRQGEAGCPSQWSETRALNKYPWTELTQAKHVLRRMLADLGRDKESSVFGIMDMKYPDEMNRKGLLKAREDLTVEYPKPAYYAVQNLASVFDDRLTRIRDYPVEISPDLPLSVFGYEHRAAGVQVVTAWFHDEIPSNDNKKTPVDFTFSRGRFAAPVYVDLRTGLVYELPRSHWNHEGGVYRFIGIPCYDCPILIADEENLFFNRADSFQESSP